MKYSNRKNQRRIRARSRLENDIEIAERRKAALLLRGLRPETVYLDRLLEEERALNQRIVGGKNAG